MPQVLFLCTGNYYRSRLAEIVFNELAAKQKSAWSADSRGLQISGGNVGPISVHTQRWLRENGIPLPEPIRFPIPAKEADFWKADRVVAVKEAEHRSMMASAFPQWLDRTEFWHIHDLDFADPAEALPGLIAHVERLFTSLHA